ncbi:MAG: phosphate ABC transporter permease subunit PstC [Atopobiaceae bacterium]|nr:phosphate ABC transporter permease subunit PstC [Atopobiaceae bacterium]MCH4180478.1 phosphate ABC transporter permease subunit PstC [Atopobiaceae bacterium]MCH4214172.1 phosphate ABC transporter permease subunit PstC [Atopobiaceae bacterium]MCH4229483.1 phosphate ABC transporter permease subunit PstC [Atopobiaceae bacterium]MCH4275838.1 phosphate ABC transporter permease subunit PstC [Atopobiaceae bacterium]
MSEQDQPVHNLKKPPHLEDIEPNKGSALSATSHELKLVSHATYVKERSLQYLFLACACVAVVGVCLIFVFTTWKSWPVFTDIGLSNFFGFVWAPSEGSYGIMSLLAGSGLVTVGALALGVPLAIGCAVYLTEIANKRVTGIVSTAVDLLAGIPSVIYGFFGMVMLRPLIAQLSGGLGFGALTAWLVLAIMIVPTITTLTMDALRSVPMGIREASYSMGATKWQTIYKVVLPAAKNGIVNAVVLGMGRAIGETMAVLMVVGNAPVLPDSITSPLSTLTSQIALDMGYASGLHRSALFGMGVVLFVISACLVGIVRLISRDRSAKDGRPKRSRKVQVAAPAATPAGAVPMAPAQAVPIEKDAEPSAVRIKRLLAHGANPRVSKDATNKTMLWVFRVAAGLATAVLVLIIAFVTVNGLPVMSLDFIFGWPEGVNAEGGIWPTIVSTLYVTALAMVICTPIAVLAAVYLAEYAKQGRLVTFIRYAADTLSSVPSIVLGLFGYAMFVEAMGLGLSMISAALALALMMLPIVMRTTEEAIRAVPRYIRWGAYGLGATKWQVVSRIVLPSAFPRIATGIVLGIGRAIGETAVVLYTMGQAINLPVSPLDSGRPMTIHLYLLANDGINMNAAYGTALLLMVMILAFNLFARYLSRKSASKSGRK